MTGREIRLGRLFTHANAVVVAVDHGMFDGPYLGIEDIPAALTQLGDEADAILLSPGALPATRGFFGRRGAPLAIVRINFNSVFLFSWGYREAACAPLVSPRQAAALGAELVLICLTLSTGSEARDAYNAELFARLCAEAHECGLPVVGEYFPHSHAEKLARNPEGFAEEIVIGCRMLQELGADCIKTFHTPGFADLTRGVGIPILGLGAEKTATDLEALELAGREMRDGARGVVFGRNCFQASDPRRFLAALAAVVRRGTSPAEACRDFGLTA